MKKLLLIMLLAFWSCEEEAELLPEEVTLWGENYPIETTTHLYLTDNQLTGSIPPDIGNMTNLLGLYLNDNQLTGILLSKS